MPISPDFTIFMPTSPDFMIFMPISPDFRRFMPILPDFREFSSFSCFSLKFRVFMSKCHFCRFRGRFYRFLGGDPPLEGPFLTGFRGFRGAPEGRFGRFSGGTPPMEGSF